METPQEASPGDPAIAAAPAGAGLGRKAKFLPKVPTRRGPKKVVPKAEPDSSEQALPEDLKRILLSSQAEGRGAGGPGQHQHGRGAAVSAVRVAFGFGASADSSFSGPQHAKLRGPSAPVSLKEAGVGAGTGGGAGAGGGAGGTSSAPKQKPGAKAEADDIKILLSQHRSLGQLSEVGKIEVKEEPPSPKAKQRKDTIDYSRYYPLTLPLHPPQFLEAETVDVAPLELCSVDAAENGAPLASSADELGLRDRTSSPRFLFFQLPAVLPTPDTSHQPGSLRDGNGAAEEGSLTDGRGGLGGIQGSREDLMDLDEEQQEMGGMEGEEGWRKKRKKGGESVMGGVGVLPTGRAGKLRVYEDGSVDLKLGDVVLEAIPGARCIFHQDLVALNADEKECHFLGEVRQRVVLQPDIDSLLS